MKIKHYLIAAVLAASLCGCSNSSNYEGTDYEETPIEETLETVEEFEETSETAEIEKAESKEAESKEAESKEAESKEEDIVKLNLDDIKSRTTYIVNGEKYNLYGLIELNDFEMGLNELENQQFQVEKVSYGKPGGQLETLETSDFSEVIAKYKEYAADPDEFGSFRVLMNHSEGAQMSFEVFFDNNKKFSSISSELLPTQIQITDELLVPNESTKKYMITDYPQLIEGLNSNIGFGIATATVDGYTMSVCYTGRNDLISIGLSK